MLGIVFRMSAWVRSSTNDASVYSASSFANAIENPPNPLSILPARFIPGTPFHTPMLFVADDVYPLKPFLMKPFR